MASLGWVVLGTRIGGITPYIFFRKVRKHFQNVFTTAHNLHFRISCWFCNKFMLNGNICMYRSLNTKIIFFFYLDYFRKLSIKPLFKQWIKFRMNLTSSTVTRYCLYFWIFSCTWDGCQPLKHVTWSPLYLRHCGTCFIFILIWLSVIFYVYHFWIFVLS